MHSVDLLVYHQISLMRKARNEDLMIMTIEKS
jgi:hypothetical protein